MQKYWATKQIAERCNVSNATVLKHIKESRLKAVKFGKQWRVSEEALNEFIKENDTGSNEGKIYALIYELQKVGYTFSEADQIIGIVAKVMNSKERKT